MSQDREWQVRQLFLTEAREYLDRLESDLLNLSQGGLDRPTLDKMLRALHSIKGGAAMMGFLPLSDVAHRVEDFFNILKSGRVKAIATDLERLFLISVDKMREVIAFHNERSEVKSEWIDTHITPIFHQLHSHLGDYSAEDNASVLSADSGEDMQTFMFETEVDTCLERLQQVLAEPNSPVIREEFLIASQEFGCLGEMLDLPAFTSLCQSVTLAIESQPTPKQMREIAESALKLWRRSQALVSIGQIDSMPSQLNLSVQLEVGSTIDRPVEQSIAIVPIISDEVSFSDDEILYNELDRLLAIDSDLEFDVGVNLNDIPPDLLSDDNRYEIDLASDSVDLDVEEFDILTATNKFPDLISDLTSDSEVLSNISGEVTPSYQSPELSQPVKISTKPDLLSSKIESKESKNDSENTIRVAVRQLNRLADLSGDFTSERNTLNLQLKQFRNLVELLRRRVQSLEQSNSLLRTSYDRVATYATPLILNSGLNKALSHSDNFSNGSNSGLSSEFSDRFDLLEMDRYSDLHLISREIMDNVVKLEEVTSDIETALAEVETTEREFGRTNKQMQIGITQVRMRPLSDIVGKFPRVIREMSLQYGKQVELKIRGGNTLIEQTILEALNDPLLHLLRNAFDHGIEPTETRIAKSKPAVGSIVINASYRGSQTIITIEDDGGGIDIDKVRAKALKMGLSEDDLDDVSQQEILELIFEPGFSTASQVTDLSGRGVGMDVVRSNLREVKGTVSIGTEKGKGSTFTIAIPISLSITRVLLVESNGMLIAFPTNDIEEMLLFSSLEVELQTKDDWFDDDKSKKIETEVIDWENYTTPLIHLNRYLKFSQSQQFNDTGNIPIVNEPVVLIVSRENRPYAIQCDRYWGEQEVATRLVDGMNIMPMGFTGCAIVRGKVVPLVDSEKLIDLIFNNPESYGFNNSEAIAPIQNIDRKTIMIVDDSINVRRFLALTLEKSGYRVEQAKDGQEALEKLQANLTTGQTINAIICDIEMPRLDGFGFLAQSQAEDKFKHIPIIMLTSRSSDKHRQLALNLGATAYFSKPFKEIELLGMLTKLTADRSQSAYVF